MNSPRQQPKSITIVEAVFAAPILFAFLIGSLPVLIPILVFRLLRRRSEPAATKSAAIESPLLAFAAAA